MHVLCEYASLENTSANICSPEIVMGALDGVLIGLISDLLLSARYEVEDGVHPATALPRLCSSTGCQRCWV